VVKNCIGKQESPIELGVFKTETCVRNVLLSHQQAWPKEKFDLAVDKI